ncbi:MAG: hypothetical protein P0Y53_01860 [Candidatus Pseudobacter hemicellulosilyticus]|uniref:Uncharacterized protein n=1 Tax=Candidatus Pseudobacter hemicellulosilyticus TaxID=3121375 RepID=A0AAJ6BHF5_9BACT|nr:MAG: hypothetical protein P0Y53_01860 [Pseudobacter sp.]
MENENDQQQEQEHSYRTFETISILFAVAFTAGMFVKFLFF